MAVYYVDASAIVKRYRSKQETKVIAILLNEAPPEDRFYTSFLSVLEVTSGFHRLAAAGQLEEALIQELLARFRRDLNAQFRLWPLTNDIVAEAMGVVEEHRLRSADALHLATALSISALAADASLVMVSSDRELLRSAVAAGLVVLDPQAGNALSRLGQLRRSGTR